MTTYERFEDVPVWRESIALARSIFDLTNSRCLRGRWGLRDQIERATVSISSNIAEGYERGTTKDTIHFLRIAMGSAAEVRSLLQVAKLLELQTRENEILTESLKQAETISRQLYGWAVFLTNAQPKRRRNL